MSTRTAHINNAISPKAIAKALEYSDAPETLEELIEHIELHARCLGVVKDPEDDKQGMLDWYVTIRRGQKAPYSFHFYGSRNDGELWTRGKEYTKRSPFTGQPTKYWKPVPKQEILDGLLYDVLACTRSDYYCPETFADFCSEYGYDDDSIAARNLFEKCREHAVKLHRALAFTDAELECLPC